MQADVAGDYTVSELEVALRVDADIISDYTFEAGSLSFDYTVGIGDQLAILEISDDTQTHRAEVNWIGNTAPTLQLDDPGQVSQGEPLTLTGMVDDGETAPEDLIVTWFFDGEEVAANGPLSDGSISLSIAGTTIAGRPQVLTPHVSGEGTRARARSWPRSWRTSGTIRSDGCYRRRRFPLSRRRRLRVAHGRHRSILDVGARHEAKVSQVAAKRTTR